jgi:2'-5' RNA ligase
MTPPASDNACARLFVALWPGSAMRVRIAAHQREWAWPPGAVPVARERLHLTLHFLGAVPRSSIAALRCGLCVAFDRFEIGLEQAELWRGGVAVLRPAELPPALDALRERLDGALERLQQPSDGKPFKPHLTLARRAQGAMPPRQPAGIRWPVGGYALIESELRPPSRYRVLQRYP